MRYKKSEIKAMHWYQKNKYFDAGSSTTMEELEELAYELLDVTWVFKIRYGRFLSTKKINLRKLGWSFSWNAKKTYIGQAHYFPQIIYLSSYFMTKENLKNRAAEFEDTIRHEIAHALDYTIRGTSDHGKKWKAIAKQVGCVPKARAKTLHTPTGKYTLTCGDCGVKLERHRKPKYDIACRACCNKHNGGSYSDKYKMNLKQNW